MERREERQDVMGYQNLLVTFTEEIDNISPFLVRVRSPTSESFFSSLGPASSVSSAGLWDLVSLLKKLC